MNLSEVLMIAVFIAKRSLYCKHQPAALILKMLLLSFFPIFFLYSLFPIFFLFSLFSLFSLFPDYLVSKSTIIGAKKLKLQLSFLLFRLICRIPHQLSFHLAVTR